MNKFTCPICKKEFTGLAYCPATGHWNTPGAFPTIHVCGPECAARFNRDPHFNPTLMTKQFCDICGHLAADSPPSMKAHFPDLKWRGCRSTPGSISPTDGNWTPYIDARIVFDAHEFKDRVGEFHPDLCVECQARILQQMAAQILEKLK